MWREETQPDIRVGGSTVLRTVAPHFGELVITQGPHGPYEATFSIPLRSRQWRHPDLRSRRKVEILLGAERIFGGRFNDCNFDAGTFSAEGYCREAEGALALNNAGRPTTFAEWAVDEAIDRGVVSWRRIGDWGVPGVGFVGPFDGDSTSDDPDPVMLDALLDSETAEAGGEWVVDALGRLDRVIPDDEVDWIVPPGVASIGTATDERIDRVLISYRDSGDDDHRRVASFPASTPVGGIEAVADVSRKISMSTARANGYAETIYRRVNGGKDGWTNAVIVGPGQLLTPGGQRAHFSQVKAHQNVKLLGVPDPRDGVQGDVVFRLETAVWAVNARTLTLNPVGLADRSFEAIARRILPQPKKDKSTRAHGSTGGL